MLIRDPDYLRVRGLVVTYAAKGLVVTYTQPGQTGLLIEDCIAYHIEGLYRPNSSGIPEWRDKPGTTGDGFDASAGIAVTGAPGRDITIRDCEMFHTSWGFFVVGDKVTLDRIYCHHCYTHNTCPHPAVVRVRDSVMQNCIFDASGGHAFAGTMGIMLVDTQNFTIRNCTFRNLPDSGSHDEGGIDFENRGDRCLIDKCTFENNAGAAIEVLGLSVAAAEECRDPQFTIHQEQLGEETGTGGNLHLGKERAAGPAGLLQQRDDPQQRIRALAGRRILHQRGPDPDPVVAAGQHPIRDGRRVGESHAAQQSARGRRRLGPVLRPDHRAPGRTGTR